MNKNAMNVLLVIELLILCVMSVQYSFWRMDLGWWTIMEQHPIFVTVQCIIGLLFYGTIRLAFRKGDCK